MRFSAFLLTVSCCLGLARTAVADEDVSRSASTSDGERSTVRTEARERFARGVQLYEAGEFSLALIEFERTYELVPLYGYLYNIGQVNLQLGRYAQARKALEQYLAEGRGHIPTSRVQEVETDLRGLLSRTAFLVLHCNEAGATVLVDDRPVGTTPVKEALLVDAGEHRILVRKEGFTADPALVRLAGDDRQEVQLRLLRDRPAVVVAPLPIREEDSQTWKYIGWTAVGVGAVGTALSGSLALTKASTLAELRDERPSSIEERQTLATHVRNYGVVADVLGVSTLLGTGIMLYASMKPGQGPSNSVAASLRLSPTSVRVEGSF